MATEDTELDLDFVGLVAETLGAGEANELEGSRLREGVTVPVGVGTGEGCAELLIPIVNEGFLVCECKDGTLPVYV